MKEEVREALPGQLANRFIERCQQRGEDPKTVLERLIIDYIRGDDLDSKIAEMHAAIVNPDKPIMEQSADAHLMQLLEEYDPSNEGKLTYEH